MTRFMMSLASCQSNAAMFPDDHIGKALCRARLHGIGSKVTTRTTETRARLGEGVAILVGFHCFQPRMWIALSMSLGARV